MVQITTISITLAATTAWLLALVTSEIRAKAARRRWLCLLADEARRRRACEWLQEANLAGRIPDEEYRRRHQVLVSPHLLLTVGQVERLLDAPRARP